MKDFVASAAPRPVPPEASPWHYWLAIPRSMIAIWSERTRVRWDLERMSKDNPHLIADIGLTQRQVEAEIAKPFWRA
jgi:uncharacterized protein YjiS (DUF1127 family)